MSKSQNIKKQNPAQSQAITGFEGYFSFLSNDFPTWVHFEGLNYPSVSTAFQAARTDDQKTRQKISTVTDTEQFRKIAMGIPNPVDWNERKQKIMTNLVRDKFKRNKQILDKLMATKQKKLINTMKSGGFNQEYWGVFDGKGKNILGRILMNVREEFLKGIDTKQWIQNNLNLENDVKMCATVSILVEKDGKKVQRLNLDKQKNYYLFGSLKTVDFNLQNPTISRNHACLYFSQLQVLIVDLKSTHGTFLKHKDEPQRQQLQPLLSYRLYKDDILQFGTSARQYIISIDRTQIEKYIAEQQNNLKTNLKDIPEKYENVEQFAKLSKEDVKNMLGIQSQCLMVEGLGDGDKDGYQGLKEYFGKLEKVASIRMKVNSKTGKSEGIAIIYFTNPNAVSSLLKKKQQLQYKIRGISKSEAESILSKPRHNNPRKSISKSRSRQRQRSRSKSNEKERSRDKNERRDRNRH